MRLLDLIKMNSQARVIELKNAIGRDLSVAFECIKATGLEDVYKAGGKMGKLSLSNANDMDANFLWSAMDANFLWSVFCRCSEYMSIIEFDVATNNASLFENGQQEIDQFNSKLEYLKNFSVWLNGWQGGKLLN